MHFIKSVRILITVLVVSFFLFGIPVQRAHSALFYSSSKYKKIYNEMVALELELKLLKREYKNDRANMKDTIRGLKNNIDSLTKQIENLNKEYKDAKARSAKKVKELEKRTDILKKKGTQREKQLIAENRKTRKGLEKEIEKLRIELKKERTAHIKEVSDCKREYGRRVADLEKKIANLNDELATLKRLSKKQKGELSRMESQANEFEKKLKKEIENGEIRLKRFHDKLIINIDDRISFASGSAQLKKAILPALRTIRKILSQYPENGIVIEGHTDNVPIHSSRFRDNWKLSTERALSVLRYILKNKKLNRARFSASGFSKYNPIVPNDTQKNRALNRRVDIVVIPRLKK